MAAQKADDGAIAEEDAGENSEDEDFVQNARRLKPQASQKATPGPKLSSD